LVGDDVAVACDLAGVDLDALRRDDRSEQAKREGKAHWVGSGNYFEISGCSESVGRSLASASSRQI
jgi:hypothetical protein